MPTRKHKVNENSPDKFTSAERETEVIRLYTAGWLQARIAAHLGITQPAVSLIITRVLRRYAEENATLLAEFKAGQVARLDYLLDQAMQAWERSTQPTRYKAVTKRPKVESGERTGEGSGARGQVRGKHAAQQPLPLEPSPLEIESVQTRLTDSVGDPRFLSVAGALLADQRKILGLDAATKVEVTSWRDEAKSQGYDPEVLKRDFVKQLLIQRPALALPAPAQIDATVDATSAPPDTTAADLDTD